MLDIIIQHTQQTLFDYIKDGFMFSSNVAITFITLYTAWLRFIRKRIDLNSFGCSWNRHLGDIISLVIENKTLSNFTISKIDLVVEDKYSIQVRKYDEPFVIEPFKAYKVQSKGITSTTPIEISKLNHMINFSECYCILYTSKGKIYSNPAKNRNFFKKHNKELTLISQFSNGYNGMTLNADVKYALNILCESGKYKDILIDKHGLMSEDLFGFNSLPEDVVKDFDTCYNFFKNIGVERGLKFYFYNVAMGEDRKYYRFVSSNNSEQTLTP